jgi:hypothetical protein
MKNLFLIFLASLLIISCEQTNKNVITADIDNFWIAYDSIVLTSDSTAQMQYLQTLYLDKGTPGLSAIMAARNYTPEEYLLAINAYPKFWKSIRPNMEKVKNIGTQINQGIEQLRAVYPDLKPAKVYFTVGVFRTGGTTMDSLVLIGSEVSMTNNATITAEFPKEMTHLKNHFANNPMSDIVFLNVHEFVHTQQKTALEANLLTQCLREGVAEFIAEKATKQTSKAPAIIYGNTNKSRVKQQFLKEMFNNYYRYWLWSNYENQFNTRDLGYFLGYDMAKHYYNKMENKQAAIKTLIELDYTNDKTVEEFIDKMTYFNKSIAKLKTSYQENRPMVTNIIEFENGSKNINPNIKRVTIEFSTKMDTRFRGFELGDLGEQNVMRVENIIGWSNDDKAFTFEVNLEYNKHYQLVLSHSFSSIEGVELEDYLIDFWTGE